MLERRTRNGINLLDRTYDYYGNVTTEADAEGNTFTFEYDNIDRLEKRGLAGANIPEEFGYNRFGILTWKKLTTQAEYKYTWDSLHIDRQSTSDDFVYALDRDDDWNILVRTAGGVAKAKKLDYANRIVRNEAIGEDENGDPVVAMVGEWLYDENGNLLSEKNPRGEIAYTYDVHGQIETVNRGTGYGGIVNTYDDDARLKTHTDTDGQGPVAATSYVYDSLDRVTDINDPRGQDWQYEYWPNKDTLRKVTNPRGNTTVFHYDNNDHLVQKDLPGGGTVDYSPDNNGDIVAVEDPLGNTWNTPVDPLRRHKGVTTPEGAAYQAEADPYGFVENATFGTRTINNTGDGIGNALTTSVNGKNTTRKSEEQGLKSVTDPTGLNAKVDSRDNAGMPDKTTLDPGGRNIETNLTMHPDGILKDSSTEQHYDPAVKRNRELNFYGDICKLTTSTSADPILEQVLGGWRMPHTIKNPHYGMSSLNIEYDNGGLVTERDFNGRKTQYVRDEMGNATEIQLPDGTAVTQTFDPYDQLSTRSVPLSTAVSRQENITRDGNLNITQHTVAGSHVTQFTYDTDNRLETLVNPDGVTRTLAYNDDGNVTSDGTPAGGVAYSYSDGFLSGVNADSQPTYDLERDEAGRLIKVKNGASVLRFFGLDTAKHINSITDDTASLGGSVQLNITPESAGYGRTLQFNRGGSQIFELKRPRNDIFRMTSSELDIVGAGSKACGFTLLDHFRVKALNRPDGTVDSTFTHNSWKEITGIDHGGMTVSSPRDNDTGFVNSRTRSDLGVTDSYTVNNIGWITEESRSGRDAQYEYRADGVRTSYTLNGRTAEFLCSDAGAVQEIRNAVLGDKLRAPYEDDAQYDVPAEFATVAEAAAAVYDNRGNAAFTHPAVIVIRGALSTPVDLSPPTSTVIAVSDDFDDGTLAAWTVQETGAGTVDPAQTAIRLGTTGYAPRFDTAAAGDQAYAEKTLPVNSANTFSQDFQLYIDAAGPASGDTYTLCRLRDDTRTLVEFRVVSNADGTAEIEAWHCNTAKKDNPPLLVFGNRTTVDEDTWHRLRFTYVIQLGAERFHWSLNGATVGDFTNMTVPAGTSFEAFALGMTETDAAGSLVIDRAQVHDTEIDWLNPTADNPLIIRNATDREFAVEAPFRVDGVDHVRLQGARVRGGGTVLFENADGPQLASCILETATTLRDCADALIVGNTFDYRDATKAPELLLDNCADATLRNNLVLNRDADNAVAVAGPTPDSDYNCWWPTPSPFTEPYGLNADPNLAPGEHFTNDETSPLVSNGVDMPGFRADLNGWYRHATSPCIGAVEFEFEQTVRDAAGRITKRTVAGRDYLYDYDGAGRLVEYTDTVDSDNSADYEYDWRGRRTLVDINAGPTWRFVYDTGDDPVAALVDWNGNGSVDTTRVYWTLQDIDRRIGFVDIDESTGDADWYYYLTDQVGSVLAVVDADGDTVNRYDYDAYGNPIPENTFETVPNRYRFHGREYDAHRGDYHYRHRTYIPEWGLFTSPDPDIRVLDPNGACNYLFCSNNPTVYVDPFGLEVVFAGRDPSQVADAKKRYEDFRQHMMENGSRDDHALLQAMDSPGTRTEITVTDRLVSFANHSSNEINVTNIGRLGDKGPFNARSVFAHEVIEQYYLQNEDHGYGDAHPKACSKEVIFGGYDRQRASYTTTYRADDDIWRCDILFYRDVEDDSIWKVTVPWGGGAVYWEGFAREKVPDGKIAEERYLCRHGVKKERDYFKVRDRYADFQLIGTRATKHGWVYTLRGPQGNEIEVTAP